MSVATSPSYAGLVTRGVAFVIDAAIINAIAFAVGASASLALSTFGVSLDELPTGVSLAVGAGGWLVLNVAYFAGSWALTGQTRGMRLMAIRVERTHGEALSFRRGLRRLVGMVIAALPLFAGYLLILVDDRRRGLHDRLAGTVVVFLTEEERQARRGLRRRPSRRIDMPAALCVCSPMKMILPVN
jgi:uncharacterized RDD family membrane protein YckC